MELKPPPGAADRPTPSAASRWFRRESVSLGEIALQTFSVVLGILLALGIDGWKRDREQKQDVEDAMRAVRTELAANREALKRNHDHLIAVENDLRAKDIGKTGTELACNQYKGWSGTGMALLVSAAYQTAIATQAFAHMEFARAQTIAAAYGLQAAYLDYLGKIIDVILRGGAMPPESCAGILDELARFADTLDSAYAKAIDAPAGAGPAAP